MPLDEFIINVYCEICEAYAAVTSTPLRRRGFAPTLSDEEALTMEIVGAYLGMSQDKQIWSYFHCHWRAWFPRLGARSTFVRQSANLWALKQCMHRHWVRRLGACKGAVHLVDGFPVPVCHFRRAHFSQGVSGRGDVWLLRLQTADLLRLQGHATHQQGRGDSRHRPVWRPRG